MRGPPSLQTLTKVAHLIQARHPLKSAFGESFYLLLHLEQSRRPTAEAGILDWRRWALLLPSSVTCETNVGRPCCVACMPLRVDMVIRLRGSWWNEGSYAMDVHLRSEIPAGLKR